MSRLNAITIAFILGVSATTIQAQIIFENVTIFNNENYMAATFSFTAFRSHPDLTNLGPLFPKINGIHFKTEAIWVLHSVPNYGSSGSVLVIPRSWASFWPGATIGSLRYIGSQNWNPQLHLFFDEKYSANTTRILFDYSNLDYQFRSLILTGDTSAQLFTLPDYKGASYCVEASNGKSISDISSIGLQVGAIKSIKFGCDGLQMKSI